MFVVDKNSFVSNSFAPKLTENQAQPINDQFIGTKKVFLAQESGSRLRIDNTTPLYHEFSIINVDTSMESTVVEIDFSSYSNSETSGIEGVEITRVRGGESNIIEGNIIKIRPDQYDNLKVMFYTRQLDTEIQDKNLAVIQFYHINLPEAISINDDFSIL